jgi:tetratricopeptide (TPR) repeat protein
MTEANGRFSFSESSISITKTSNGQFPQLFLYVNIEGLSPIFQAATICSSGNILMLKRGETSDLDRTYREPIPLTRVEALRAELVKQYNELAVREYEQALRDILNKKNDNAIGHLNKAIKAAPEFVDAYMQLGMLQYQAQRLEEAEQALRRAVSLKPAASGPLTELGRVLIDKAKALEQAGDSGKASATYAEATDQLKKAVSAAPWLTEAYYYLGSALYKLNQLAEAESALQSALTGDQPWQDARLMLVNIYVKQRRYTDALAQLKAFIDAVPDSPQRGAAEKLQAQIQEALKQP